jgi:hypothetical protein
MSESLISITSLCCILFSIITGVGVLLMLGSFGLLTGWTLSTCAINRIEDTDLCTRMNSCTLIERDTAITNSSCIDVVYLQSLDSKCNLSNHVCRVNINHCDGVRLIATHFNTVVPLTLTKSEAALIQLQSNTTCMIHQQKIPSITLIPEVWMMVIAIACLSVAALLIPCAFCCICVHCKIAIQKR